MSSTALPPPGPVLRAAARALTLAAIVAVALVSAPPPAAADNDGVELAPMAEVLVRFRHAEGHDFTDGGVTNTVRQRARLGLSVNFLQRVAAFVQMQDVRTWGEETDTLGDYDADGLDLHQGYLDFALSPGMRLRVGRQEISYLNQRLVGAVGFAEQARSFDAARWSLTGMGKSLNVDLFYARTRDAAPADYTGATDVFAGFLQYRVTPGFVPALIAVSDVSGPMDRVRVTGGLLVLGVFDFGLAYQVEGYYQGGRAADGLSYAAWFAAVRARYTVDFGVKPYLELFADVASGDDDPSDKDVHAFDTLFATNHKFYGEMDLFTNLPLHTQQRGLIDLGAAIGVSLGDDLDLVATQHLFSVPVTRGGPGTLGVETDMKGVWRLAPHLTWDLVYAVFVPEGGLTGDGPSDPEHFVYSTLTAAF